MKQYIRQSEAIASTVQLWNDCKPNLMLRVNWVNSTYTQDVQKRCLAAPLFLCWCIVWKSGFVKESHIQDACSQFYSTFHVQYARICYWTWHRRECQREVCYAVLTSRANLRIWKCPLLYKTGSTGIISYVWFETCV